MQTEFKVHLTTFRMSPQWARLNMRNSSSAANTFHPCMPVFWTSLSKWQLGKCLTPLAEGLESLAIYDVTICWFKGNIQDWRSENCFLKIKKKKKVEMFLKKLHLDTVWGPPFLITAKAAKYLLLILLKSFQTQMVWKAEDGATPSNASSQLVEDTCKRHCTHIPPTLDKAQMVQFCTHSAKHRSQDTNKSYIHNKQCCLP